MTQQTNYKSIIQEGIFYIQEWINNQQQNVKESEDFKELQRVINDIENEHDYSHESFEDIRFVLRPFDELIPLKIKRIFNISTMDQYTMFISSRWFETIDDHINLILSTRRFKENMTKFHYNPISLTPITREFFTHLQTLYLYSKEDCRFDNDERIIATVNCKISKYDLFKNQIDKLEEWIGTNFGEIIFDSKVDNWSQHTSIFNRRIIGKKRLLFVIEDERREKFGYYLNTIVEQQFEKRQQTDSKSFHFNLQSNYNRLSGPTKFEIKDLKYGGFELYDKSSEKLIILGDIWLKKQNKKDFSYCNDTHSFDYKISKALCGLTRGRNSGFFKPRRIQVIQMEMTDEEKELEKQKVEIDKNQRKLVLEELKQNKKNNLDILEEWCEMKCDEIIFDSDVDESIDINTLYERITGKKNLVFLCEEDEELFGLYSSSLVQEKESYIIAHRDNKTFHFNLRSNGRFSQPMKFEMKDEICFNEVLFGNFNGDIKIGDICLRNNEYERLSYCESNEYDFEYYDIEHALCGKYYFILKRIVVIQMK